MRDALQSARRRHPSEILLDAVHALDVLEQQARLQLSADASPDQVAAWASDVRAAAALAKTALDVQVDERRVRLAEDQGRLLASGLEWFLDRVALRGVARTEARRLMGVMLSALAEGHVPELEEAGS